MAGHAALNVRSAASSYLTSPSRNPSRQSTDAATALTEGMESSAKFLLQWISRSWSEAVKKKPPSSGSENRVNMASTKACATSRSLLRQRVCSSSSRSEEHTSEL